MNRIAAIDWLRGIVMILMALDHASAFFNQGRVANDSIVTHEAGSSFVVEQFFTRWITHLSAPTFVFLTGTAMALSIMQRREKGMHSKAIDRDLLIRGAFIALLDIVVFSFMGGKLYLQVLYAIGGQLDADGAALSSRQARAVSQCADPALWWRSLYRLILATAWRGTAVAGIDFCSLVQ